MHSCCSCAQATEESIVAGCASMVIYGLFSGQPLTLIGSTGPVLVFETIVFKLCECAPPIHKPRSL